jgi:hypothetical protein
LAVVEYLWETQLAALVVDRVYVPTGYAEAIGIPLELTFDCGERAKPRKIGELTGWTLERPGKGERSIVDDPD